MDLWNKFKYDPNGESGTWMNSAKGDPLPIIICPNCGCGLLGVSSHIINNEGNVMNSVMCECGFHEYVKLLNYKKYRDRKYRSER
jgi:hypothetical protein